MRLGTVEAGHDDCIQSCSHHQRERQKRERERRAGLAGIGAIIKHFFPYGVQ